MPSISLTSWSAGQAACTQINHQGTKLLLDFIVTHFGGDANFILLNLAHHPHPSHREHDFH